MALPFRITSELPAVGLYALSDGRYQLIKQGPVAPFMPGHGYLIVEKTLADFLVGLRLEDVRCEPVTLWNRSTGEEHKTHARVHVGQSFTAARIHELPLEGPRLLVMNDEFYFASPDLKARLEASPFTYLRFSEGLRGLVG
jgi:hypothetical protein